MSALQHQRRQQHSMYRASLDLLVEAPHAAAAWGSDDEPAAPSPTVQLSATATVAEVAHAQLPLYACPGEVIEQQFAGKVRRVASPIPALPAGAAAAPLAVAAPSSAKGAPRRSPSDPALASGYDDSQPQPSLLEVSLATLWEDRADQGLFRYDVSVCPTKVVPGSMGFVAQLNVGRATQKRATEFKLDQVEQPFDGAKFNFKKARLNEVLLQFEPGTTAAAAHVLRRAPPATSSPNLVLINVSPIERGHVLLVPRVLSDLPQLVDESTALLALQFAAEIGTPAMRVGYNSLGAYGTINHLHFHAYNLDTPLPCERAPTAPLRLFGGAGHASAGNKRPRVDGEAPAVLVSRLVGYPVRGFVIEAEPQVPASGGQQQLPPSAAALEAVAAVLGRACEALRRAGVPHNFVVSDAGRRVFLFPQCYSERQARGEVAPEYLDTGVNPAAFEIAGHLLLKRAEDFTRVDEAFACALLGQVSLSEERFQHVAGLCFGSC